MAHGLRERGIAVRQMPLPAILALVHPQLHTSLDTACRSWYMIFVVVSQRFGVK